MSIEGLINQYAYISLKSVLIVLLTIALFSVIFLIVAYVTGQRERFAITFIGAIVGMMVGFILALTFGLNNTTIERWKTTHLKTYLEQQEEQTLYFDKYVVIPKSDLNAIYTTNQKEADFINVKLSFSKNGMPNEVKMKTLYKKENTQKPYLTYKQVEKTITDDFSVNDYYEAVLHVPIVNQQRTNHPKKQSKGE